MSKPKYLRKKTAKGKTYWYFDTGQKTPTGSPILTPLPSPKSSGFGGAYARAQAARTSRKGKQGILTFDGLIRIFEKSPEFHALAEASKRSYSHYLAKANSLIRDRAGDSPPARAIERGDVIKLRDTLSDTPGAASQTVRAIGALYAWALENERVKHNPADKVKKFKGKEHEPWPQELVEEALADPQIGLAVGLFYFTGQRINEVVRMSWRDIVSGHMEVFNQKGQRHIRVAILPELAEMLEAAPKTAVTILTNANGQPWTQSGLRQKLQDWASQRGHRVVPHGLRKNAVNSLFEAGCTAAEVSGITDQSLKMLEHYSKRVNKLSLGQAAVVKFDAARRARNKAGK
jgi:integrase